MEETTPHDFIVIGMLIAFLAEMKAGLPASKASKWVSNLTEALSDEALVVTMGVADNLTKLGEELDERDDDEGITSEEIEKIRKELGHINISLASESRTLMLFKATERQLNIEQLFKKPEQFVSAEIWEEMPEIAKYDLEQSAKAIVYGLPTASALQILRATEGVLNTYYEYFIRQKRIKEDKRTWGNMTKVLREKKGGRRPSSAVILHLDDIRNNYRNPTAHPHGKYDIDEAQTLFIMCCEAIRRMTTDKAAK